MDALYMTIIEFGLPNGIGTSDVSIQSANISPFTFPSTNMTSCTPDIADYLVPLASIV